MQDGSSEDDFPEQGGYPTPEGFLFGSIGGTSRDLVDLHPPPVHIFRLWQTFLVNVNPMVKMFHAPTIQQMILDASGDLANVPRHTEALMFAIYFISVISLQDQDCRSMFHESKANLLAKYSTGAQQSLVNSRFLKSLNILTLQAFILYLVSVDLPQLPENYCGLISFTARSKTNLRSSLLVGSKWCCCSDIAASWPSSRWWTPQNLPLRR